MKMNTLQDIGISPTAFWDVNVHKLDVDAKPSFVISKVMDFGTLEDFKNLMGYYGEGLVKSVVLESSYLEDRTIAFCCAIFNLNPEHFKCYTKKRLSRERWIF